jgi:pimeloyl-ACP methyl ester carboxylesterase
VDQVIQFVTADDGTRLAYASSGSGPALLKTANWLNHLEYDWQSPVWNHWFTLLSRHHTLYRYDQRGSGLSDRVDTNLDFERQVADLEQIADAAGLGRFALPSNTPYAIRSASATSCCMAGSRAAGRNVRPKRCARGAP